jgi:hypothetical protein
MSLPFSEETHRNLVARVPACTGRELPDWFREIEAGPAFSRFEDRVSWLQGEHNLGHGHALAIVREHDRRRHAPGGVS